MTLPLMYRLLEYIRKYDSFALLLIIKRKPLSFYGFTALAPVIGAALGFGAALLGGTGGSYGYVIILPVIWLAAQEGVYGGLFAAIVANVSSVLIYSLIGSGSYPALDLQVLFAVTTFIGLTVGAAFDELRRTGEERRKAEIELVKRRMQEEELRHMAFFDYVTGLPSRRLVMDRLGTAVSAARRNDTMIAILFIDLDGFKAVNDHLGHDAGDHLLWRTGTRLLSCVRETDTVGRLGGDEFIVILTDLHHRDDALPMAHKIVDVLADQIDADGTMLSVGASVGISFYPECGQDPECLVKRADAAMYRAKHGGKGRFALCDATDGEAGCSSLGDHQPTTSPVGDSEANPCR
ncbi:sensor domain-containing diguanylate cyclase [Roseospira navarrensis]|uniref:Diguanylate cyclase n=1 Tax=Roseospira navarrensis TaxID=140058 RepID=A0A7X2D3E2_9PROT|nr:diguanylate cyclase [Roseospira navarrensis]